jgi:hypothetical protein
VKTFKQYLREQKESSAPQGLIFKGNNVAYVGEEHGTPIQLSSDILQKVKTIGDKYGYWYEGSGGGVDNTKKLFGDRSNYEGSWDDEFRKNVEGYPYEFIYTLFSNPEVNGQKESITSPKLNIFDSILKNQKKFSYFKDRQFDSATLKKFLTASSEKEVDFYKMSLQPATKENVEAFIDKGDKLMWPKNWEEYPNNAGKLAYKANRARDEFLVSRKSGVYFAGSGHLKDLMKVDGSLKLIGGEKID